MNLLITSVDTIIDSSTKLPYDGIIEQLDNFRHLQEGNEVAVLSSRQSKLKSIYKRFNPTPFSSTVRQASAVTKILNSNPHFTHSDVIILGANDADFHLAANEKVLLLTAHFVSDKTSKIFGYGIKINTPSELGSFFKHFLNIKNPWYFKLQVDDKTILYSLINAMTKSAPQDIAALKNKFQGCLKSGNRKNRELFLQYFLMSIYSPQSIEDFKSINYWGIYPSSTTEFNTDLHHFAEAARKLFKGHPSGADKNIFIRVKNTNKRHHQDSSERLQDGCNKQLETIVINPYFKDKLKGKTICIVDDFTRFGTSCETSKLLLQKEGVKKILFVTMGKFGSDYYKYEYSLLGSPFDGVKCEQLSKSNINSQGSYSNQPSDNHFLNTLKELIS